MLHISSYFGKSCFSFLFLKSTVLISPLSHSSLFQCFSNPFWLLFLSGFPPAAVSIPHSGTRRPFLWETRSSCEYHPIMTPSQSLLYKISNSSLNYYRSQGCATDAGAVNALALMLKPVFWNKTLCLRLFPSMWADPQTQGKPEVAELMPLESAHDQWQRASGETTQACSALAPRIPRCDYTPVVLSNCGWRVGLSYVLSHFLPSLLMVFPGITSQMNYCTGTLVTMSAPGKTQLRCLSMLNNVHKS